LMAFEYKTLRTRTIPKGEGLQLRFMGDLHRGEGQTDHKMFKIACDTALKENRKIYAMGDWQTSIPCTDRRYSVMERGETVAEQTHDTRMDMEKLKDIIEGWHIGNHEYSQIKTHGDFIGEMCQEIGIPYLGYQCNTMYKNSKGDTFTLYTTHGNKSYSYKAGEGRRIKVNYEVALKNNLRGVCWSNLSVQGHAHRGILSTPNYEMQLMNTGAKEYEERFIPDDDGRMYACTPSFLRIYRNGEENYGSRSGFHPTGVGFVDVDLDKNLKLIDMRLVMTEGSKFLVFDSLKKRIERKVMYE